MNRRGRHKLAMAFIREGPYPPVILWLKRRILNRRKVTDWPSKWLSFRTYLELKDAELSRTS